MGNIKNTFGNQTCFFMFLCFFSFQKRVFSVSAKRVFYVVSVSVLVQNVFFSFFSFRALPNVFSVNSPGRNVCSSFFRFRLFCNRVFSVFQSQPSTSAQVASDAAHLSLVLVHFACSSMKGKRPGMGWPSPINIRFGFPGRKTLLKRV